MGKAAFDFKENNKLVKLCNLKVKELYFKITRLKISVLAYTEPQKRKEKKNIQERAGKTQYKKLKF